MTLLQPLYKHYKSTVCTEVLHYYMLWCIEFLNLNLNYKFAAQGSQDTGTDKYNT